MNEHLSKDIVVRLNAMYHHNDVPGRQVENNDRWGVAPSITFGMTGPTRVTAQLFHQEDVNIPQYGLPYFANPYLSGPLPASTARLITASAISTPSASRSIRPR